MEVECLPLSGPGLPRQAELILAGGKMLASLDGHGIIRQLFSPHPDAAHSRVGLIKVWLRAGTGELMPLDEFEPKLELSDGLHELRAEYRHRNTGIVVRRSLELAAEHPVATERWNLETPGTSLVLLVIPWLKATVASNSASVRRESGVTFEHLGRTDLNVEWKRAPVKITAGRLALDEAVSLWAGDPGTYSFDELAELGTEARAGNELLVLGQALFSLCEFSGPDELLIRFSVPDQTQTAPPPPRPAGLDSATEPDWLARRSIEVLLALRDRETGAFIAGAEVDPFWSCSAGYGYSWPRDGCFIASALAHCNLPHVARSYFDFLARTQDASGVWFERYYATGEVAPAGGRIQIDETGTVLHFVLEHYRLTAQRDWLKAMWPMVSRAAHYLLRFHAENQNSRDLWEERDGVHAYSLAASIGGLRAAAEMAQLLGAAPAAEEYALGAQVLFERLEKDFLNQPSWPACRSRLANGNAHRQLDLTLDASALGLLFPFGIIDPRGERGQRLLDEIGSNLVAAPGSGILRYVGDLYIGGNPWILTSLWLGIAEASAGRDSAALSRLEWARRMATPHGMLAEQVDARSGAPKWVTPLGWSHAMYLLLLSWLRRRRSTGD